MRPFGPPCLPFRINLRSPQAAGLVGWWPPLGSRGSSTVREMVAGSNMSLGAVGVGLASYGEWAASLDGNTKKGDATHETRLNLLTFSVCLWFRSTATPVTVGVMLEKWDDTSLAGYPYALRCSTGGKPLGLVYDGTNAPNIVGATTINDGPWHHVVFTGVGGGSLNLYVDGKSDATAVSNTATGTRSNSYPISVSYRPSTSSFRMAGDYGELRIYDRALSAQEAARLYDPATRYDLYDARRPRHAVLAPAAGAPKFLPERFALHPLNPLAGAA